MLVSMENSLERHSLIHSFRSQIFVLTQNSLLCTSEQSFTERYQDAQESSHRRKKRPKPRRDYSSDEENTQLDRPKKRSKNKRKPGHPSDEYIQALKESAQRHKENSRLRESQEMGGAKRKQTKADKEIAELKAQLEASQKKNQQLESRVSTAGTGTRTNKKVKVPSLVNIPANHSDSVKEAFTEHCWPQTKFIANRQELKGVCARIMQALPQFQDLVAPEFADRDVAIDQFVDIYGGELTTFLNSKRTGVAGNMRKAFVARYLSGKKMPTTKELLSVIYRKNLVLQKVPDEASEDLQASITHENEEIRANLDIFRWYWEHLLPCVSGKNYWGVNIRKHVTISKGVFPDDPKKKYITSSDEALVLIAYENNYQRFPWVAECAAEKKTFKTHKDFIKKHPRYKSKWTNAKAGQCKWGG